MRLGAGRDSVCRLERLGFGRDSVSVLERLEREREGAAFAELRDSAALRLGSLGLERRFGLGRRSSAAARRVGVSQYGHTDHRGSIGLPQDSHGSLIRARQLGQRR